MRCIYESLAMKYKYTFEALEKLGNKKYNRINILGGGIKDTLLCRLTADACNVEVYAGPSEATVMGNIAVAYAALGEISDLKDIRRVVSNSTDLKIYIDDAEYDYIRIMRFFRFCAMFGKKIDRKSLKACIKNKHLLQVWI